jgi:hypothetical protein
LSQKKLQPVTVIPQFVVGNRISIVGQLLKKVAWQTGKLANPNLQSCACILNRVDVRFDLSKYVEDVEALVNRSPVSPLWQLRGVPS